MAALTAVLAAAWALAANYDDVQDVVRAVAAAYPDVDKASPESRDKRGVCAILRGDPLPLRLLGRATWWYNWGSQPNGIPDSVFPQEYVPMQWGKWGVETLDARLEQLKASGVRPRALLGFNEPNFSEQANLKPAEAAKLWPLVEAAAAKHGLRLGGPCPAPNGDLDKDPVRWMDAFLASYREQHGRAARFDFTTTHFYGCEVSWLKALIDRLKKYGRPIWLTEFACPHKTDTRRQLKFMRESLKYLDAEPAVERYAWFTLNTRGWWVGDGASLYDRDAGRLTAMGRAYVE